MLNEREKIEALLDATRARSGARGAVLLDLEGRPVTRGWPGVKVEVLAALAAASFASTREVGKVVSDQPVSGLRIECGTDCFQVWRVGQDHLVAAFYSVKETAQDSVALHFGQSLASLDTLAGRLPPRAEGEGFICSNRFPDV